MAKHINLQMLFLFRHLILSIFCHLNSLMFQFSPNMRDKHCRSKYIQMVPNGKQMDIFYHFQFCHNRGNYFQTLSFFLQFLPQKSHNSSFSHQAYLGNPFFLSGALHLPGSTIVSHTNKLLKKDSQKMFQVVVSVACCCNFLVDNNQPNFF